MRMACCLDGVILSDRTKVRADATEQQYRQLAHETEAAGYVRCYFRGMLYVFVFSKGIICAPAKMVDYDKQFAKMANRPVPFAPNPFMTRPVDPWFQAHLADYSELATKATLVINAASDDMAGELAFSQFEMAFRGAAVSAGAFGFAQAMRVRPRMITEECVREAFNAPANIPPLRALSVCCQCRERLDWLVACNATNALSMEMPGKKITPIGRIEALLLAMVASRDKEISAHKARPLAHLSCELEAPDGKSFRADLSRPNLTLDSAYELAGHLQSTKLTMETSQQKTSVRRPKLHSVFSLQEEMWKQGTAPRATLEACEQLYNEGYISWPCDSISAPWAMKVLFAQSMQRLSERQVIPNVERAAQKANDFTDWDSTEQRRNRWGIIVSGRPLPSSMPKDVQAVYQEILASNICFLTQQEKEVIQIISFACGESPLRCVQRETCFSPSGAAAYIRTDKIYPNGTICKVLSAVAEPDAPPGPYTPWELFAQCHALTEGCLRKDQAYLAAAMENLVTWEYVAPLTTGVVRLTARGREVFRYLNGTTMVNISDTLAWDGRLNAYANKDQLPTSVRDDMPAYIEDLCQEIHQACLDVQAADGHTLDDCVCPRCGGVVVENPAGGWMCDRHECGWTAPDIFKGHDITVPDMVMLLLKGKTKRISDFTSQKGPYAGYITLTQDGGLALSFCSDLTCPFCGATMNTYLWNYKCSDEGCGFSLEHTLCGHTWADDELAALLSMEKTKPLHFISKGKKEFTATAQLGDDKKIKLEYV